MDSQLASSSVKAGELRPEEGSFIDALLDVAFVHPSAPLVTHSLLIVEDDISLTKFGRRVLKLEHFSVQVIHDAEAPGHALTNE